MIGMTCRDVAYHLSNDGLEGASWGKRLLVRVHLFYCKQCRRFARGLRALDQVGAESARSAAPSPEEIRDLEGRIIAATLDPPPPQGGGSGQAGQP